MTDIDIETASNAGRRGGTSLAWLYVPIAVLFVVGGGLAVAAFIYSDDQLTVVEAIGAGYGALAGIIVALVAAAFGLITAGGAVAITLFLVGSPVIAIILFILLMRRGKRDCPDPSAHGPV